MRAYITKRLLIAVVTLLGMSMVIFFLMRLAPGNIVDILFESAGYVDQADKKTLERELGVDRPLVVQYVRWFGVLSAVHQDRPLDYVLRVLSLAGLSMPAFWLGMVVILIFVRSLGWMPSVTYVSPLVDLKANLWQFVVPALAVGYRSSALIMRITRSAMLEVLREDYIRTAWAKGQRRTLVV